MEKLIKRRATFKKALSSLDKTLKKLESGTFDDYEEIRDSAIKRFEYCTDIYWKYLKNYIVEHMGEKIELASPKPILKKGLELQILTKEEHGISISMINDRNVSSHAYDEDFAEGLREEIAGYYKVMHNVLQKTSKES